VERGRSSPTTLTGSRPFGAVAEEMRRELQSPSGHRLYVQSVEVDKALPELRPFLRLPVDRCPYGGEWRAWIGTGDHRVNLHYDGDENFFCMLVGRKRFNIAPFDVLKDIYVGPLNGPFGPPASVVDPLRPEFQRYPRFEEAIGRFATVDLNPGDVLYLPTHWWHYVESFGFNVAANYWWSDLAPHEKSKGDVLFLNALLSARALPRHWREFWAAMFEHFVFQLSGDPYEHLAPKDQGWAGTPTPARIDAIRRLIASFENADWTESVRTGELPAVRYKVSPALRLRITGLDSVVLHDSERGRDVPAGLQVVAILAQFGEPRTPREVVRAMREAGLAIQEESASSAVKELIINRMILPAD
jgi:hypothetical protein